MAPVLSKRDERRALQQQLGRDQVLDAAEEVFAAKPFHEATIKESAALAEFSVGSVYSFFANKDDLYVQIYLRRGEEFMVGMRAVLAAEQRPLDQLHDLARYQVAIMRRHPAVGRLYLRDAVVVAGGGASRVDQTVTERYETAMALQADLFLRGQAAGELRGGDPAVLARCFSGLVAAYQSTDPAIVGAPGPARQGMDLEDFLALLDGAFAA